MEIQNRLANFDESEMEKILAHNYPVQRIMPLMRLVSSMTTCKQFMPNPKMWDDPYENPYAGVEITDGAFKTAKMLHTEQCYAQCWSAAEESDATWRIYSPDKTGVMIICDALEVMNNMAEQL